MIQSVHQMWQEYYDKMAIKIQAFWRGYWLRKTVLDIKKMHCWLNEVYEKNEKTVNSMKRFLYLKIYENSNRVSSTFEFHIIYPREIREMKY